MTNSDFQN